MAAPSFVVGATGFVGRHLVGQLAARGRRTVAHVRPDSSQLERWRARFAEQGAETDATPWQVEAMAQRLRELRPEAIYICIGTTQKRAKADAEGGNPYERVDYGLTKLIVDAARAASAPGAAGTGSPAGLSMTSISPSRWRTRAWISSAVSPGTSNVPGTFRDVPATSRDAPGISNDLL